MGRIVESIEGKGYKSVAVYGGSFSPITYSHIMTISRVAELSDIDLIIIEPTNDRYEKDGLISVEDRFELIRKSLEDSAHDIDVDIYIGDYEANCWLAPSTYETMNHYNKVLNNEENDCVLHYLCGSDILEKIPTWSENAEKLVDNYSIICIDRVESKMNVEFDIINNWQTYVNRRKYIRIVPSMTFNSISSSLVRYRVWSGLSIVGLVPNIIINDVKRLYAKELTE